jgi:hypothetical protein
MCNLDFNSPQTVFAGNRFSISAFDIDIPPTVCLQLLIQPVSVRGSSLKRMISENWDTFLASNGYGGILSIRNSCHKRQVGRNFGILNVVQQESVSQCSTPQEEQLPYLRSLTRSLTFCVLAPAGS